MLDMMYNGILVFLIVLWAASAHSSSSMKIRSFTKANAKRFLVVLWIVFLVFSASYCIYLNQFVKMHDIPYAVDAAVGSEEADLNPYNHSVVPRFESKYSGSVSMTYGPYNYLPFDLLVYSESRELLGFVGMPFWFLLTNLALSGLAFLLLNEMLEVRLRYYIPLAGAVMLFFSADNVSLTLLLMVAAMFVYRRSGWAGPSLATLVMGLAAMTKVLALIPFGVLILFELQRLVRARDRPALIRVSSSVAASGAMAAALMLPFGMTNVIDSAVLFNSDAVSRVGTSTGGTFLAELSLGSAEYLLIALVLVAASALVSLRLLRLVDRMMLVSLVFMLVAVKSSQALLVIPGIFLSLRMKEVAMLAGPPSKEKTFPPCKVLEPVRRMFRRLWLRA